jgi:hypothetical protein
MPRPRLTVEQRQVSQARRRQLDAARKRRRRMDINYRQNEQQANTEARRKARQVSRILYRYHSTSVQQIWEKLVALSITKFCATLSNIVIT